jgi:hypothetical protein
MAYPDKVFPVSCTMVSVVDSYFQDYHENGEEIFNVYETITGSRTYLTKAIKGNAGCLVDLSNLRPKDSLGSNGMISAGVTNFLKIYSQINAEVTRGSVFKRGAVVLSLHYKHNDLLDFLDYPKEEINHAKRSVTVDEWIFNYPEKLEAVIKALSAGTIFVNKQVYNEAGEPLFPNVCTSIRLKSRSTCTLLPINLGKVESIEKLEQAFIDGANDIIKVWDMFLAAKLKQGEHFLDPREDKQAGLGLMGLANMLARFGISYKDFAEAMVIVTAKKSQFVNNHPALNLALAFQKGYNSAAKIAKAEGFERFFAIEPTASVSYANTDLDGYTTTPEISPPICHPITKVSRRQTQDGYEDYQYPPNVELADKDVSFNVYSSLCNSFQKMQMATGLGHGTNFNAWVSTPVDLEWFENFMESDLIAVYYRWNTAYDTQDKTSIGVEVSEEDESFWGVEEYLEEIEVAYTGDVATTQTTNWRSKEDYTRKNKTKTDTDSTNLSPSCEIETQLTGGYCAACEGM